MNSLSRYSGAMIFVIVLAGWMMVSEKILLRSKMPRMPLKTIDVVVEDKLEMPTGRPTEPESCIFGMCITLYGLVIVVSVDGPERNLESLVRARGPTIHTKFLVWSDEREKYEAVIDAGMEGEYVISRLNLVDKVETYDVESDCLLDPSSSLYEVSVDIISGTSKHGAAYHFEAYRKNKKPMLAPAMFNSKRTPSTQFQWRDENSIIELEHLFTDVRYDNVCFLGDSQMRTTLVGIYGCSELIETKETCDFLDYVYTRWDYEVLAELKRRRDSCDVFLVNFGQWDAGWPNGKFTSVEDYGKKVENFVKDALTLFSDDKSRIVWMSTNPHPKPHVELKACPPKDWRFPHVLRDYNKKSNAIMARHGVAVFNTFDTLMDVFDESYDGAHYGPKITRALRWPLAKLLNNKQTNNNNPNR